MSKYDELVKLAQAMSKTYFDDRDHAAAEISRAVLEFSQYLGMSDRKNQYCQVNSEFERSGEPGDTLTPDQLRLFEDGDWGFIVLTEYGAHPMKGGVVHVSRLSLKPERFLRVACGGQVVEGKLEDRAANEHLFDRWFSAVQNGLASGPGYSSRSIGFIEPQM